MIYLKVSEATRSWYLSLDVNISFNELVGNLIDYQNYKVSLILTDLGDGFARFFYKDCEEFNDKFILYMSVDRDGTSTIENRYFTKHVLGDYTRCKFHEITYEEILLQML